MARVGREAVSMCVCVMCARVGRESRERPLSEAVRGMSLGQDRRRG